MEVHAPGSIFKVVTGLAALEAGGTSIAVLGSGIDVIYPARHRDLYEQLSIQAGGLVLSMLS